MSIQKNYWDFMTQVKHDQFYIDLYLASSTRINSCLNIFNALVSSSSIAGWVIWQKYSFVWSLIIVISQVINAVKDYLPYNKRIKNLSEVYISLLELFNKTEYQWLSVSNGDLSEKQINDILFKLKKERDLLDGKTVGQHFLPHSKKMDEEATQFVFKYFKDYD